MLNKNLKQLTNHQLLLLVRQLAYIEEDCGLLHETFEVVKPKIDELFQNLLKEFALATEEKDREEAKWLLETIDALEHFIDTATYGKGLEDGND